jgi:hypothetical protein
MSTIRRNGKSYDNGDVKVNLFGRDDFEVTEITYGSNQPHTANYALGDHKPSSYSTGNIEFSTSMTLRLESVNAIEKAAGGNLLRIKPFNVNVTFVDENNEIINDTLLVKFTSQGRSAGSDDDLKQQFEMFALDIDWNNA